MENPKSAANGKNTAARGAQVRDAVAHSSAQMRDAVAHSGAQVRGAVAHGGAQVRGAVAHGGAQVLDDMASLIRRYLVCDEHQLTILTLWSACTQCHGHFSTAPYLHVGSPQPQSGRSLCLNILCDLVDANICFTGLTAASLLDRLIQGRSLDVIDTSAPLFPFPVFIDDCHHSFGTSERQPIVSLLTSGAQKAGFFCWGDDDYFLFGPKAIAGNSSLPDSLAARCIPIQLRRPKPSEKLVRYRRSDVRDALESLRSRLRQWLHQSSPALVQAAKNFPLDLPPALSPGQSRCAEPLVHIADAAGGPWPAKVRAALLAVFTLAEASPELQILSDVRSIFRDHGNPKYLATGDLLSELRTMDHRPWSAWTAKSGRRLAIHLRPFGIASRRLHFGSGDDFMGYLIKDFADSWDCYLPASFSTGFEPVELAGQPEIVHNDKTIASAALGPGDSLAHRSSSAETPAHAETAICALAGD